MSINKLESFLEDTEKKLNYVGHIPLLGTASGAVRLLIGIIQTLAAGIIYLISLAAYSKTSFKKKAIWEGRINASTTHLAHGLLNMGRALEEIVPFGGMALYYCY